MTQFDGAVIREQGVSFAIVVVKHHIVADKSAADQAIRSFAPAFPGLPVVLMAQDTRGVPIYYGRKDISHFMTSVPLGAVRWRRFTVN